MHTALAGQAIAGIEGIGTQYQGFVRLRSTEKVTTHNHFDSARPTGTAAPAEMVQVEFEGPGRFEHGRARLHVQAAQLQKFHPRLAPLGFLAST